jgi:hypothetical protein
MVNRAPAQSTVVLAEGWHWVGLRAASGVVRDEWSAANATSRGPGVVARAGRVRQGVPGGLLSPAVTGPLPSLTDRS